MTTALARTEPSSGALVRRDDEMTVQDLVAQVSKIQEVMHAVMKRDEHYGTIPGTGTKPTLLKAGAEKLCLLFRLDPEYEVTEQRDGAHLTVNSKCTLYHVSTGQRRGSGMGLCSTRESKYAWRKSERTCPKCGATAIIKGKQEYGGGWICFNKKGGCGAKFKDNEEAITGQPTGRVPNDDLADTYNTVLKMANKRSLVAAVLNVTAASDIFTQDLEDLRELSSDANGDESKPGAARAAPARNGDDRAVELLLLAYEDCEDDETFADLEEKRKAVWAKAGKPGKAQLKAASDRAKKRLDEREGVQDAEFSEAGGDDASA